MIRDKDHNFEEIEFNYFIEPVREEQHSPENIAVKSFKIQVPFGATGFALSAIQKGLHEFFYTPLTELGYKPLLKPEGVEKVDSDIAEWKSSIFKQKVMGDLK